MKVLVVAPHCDDETLGAGGTIARHVRLGDEVTVAVMTGHGSEPHPLGPPSLWDEVRAEARKACGVLGVRQIVFEEIPAVRVADEPVYKVNRIAQAVVEKAAPDLLYVPFPLDLHRDHRELFHAFSVAWRPSTSVGRSIRDILAYETVSETHWNVPYVEAGFLPNTFVDVTLELETKLRALSCFVSQLQAPPQARSLDAVRALAVWRGSQVGVAAAEAFVSIRRLIL